MTEVLPISLLVLQSLQVAFLWLHDWVPLGRLNDVAAVRRQDSLWRLVVVTLIQSVPLPSGCDGVRDVSASRSPAGRCAGCG